MKILHGIYDVKHSIEKEDKRNLEIIKFSSAIIILVNKNSKISGKQWNESSENDCNKGTRSINFEWAEYLMPINIGIGIILFSCLS